MENTKRKIGIIGQGFVGTAVREKFKKDFIVLAHDKDASKCGVHEEGEVLVSESPISIADIVKNCTVIFLCVPTPMFENGECDIRIVESVVDDVAKEAEFQDKNVLIILKSTVPPGTTENLNNISKNVTVIFSPEFLTEANANFDFETQNRIVIGTDYIEAIDLSLSVFKKSFPDAKMIIISSKEAEMVKYTTNLFLATKVSYFNDIYTICRELGVSYDNVIEATMHEPRIGKSHYMVPGPDGDRGFGGHCFPKDMAAILHIASNLGLAVPTITGAHVTNQIVRKNKDWEKMEGRAVSKREDREIDINEDMPGEYKKIEE